MKLCIVEDYRHKALKPLTQTRPVFGIRCGHYTMEERMLALLGGQIEGVHWKTRPDLESVWKSEYPWRGPAGFESPGPGNCLYLNGRGLFTERILDRILGSISGTRASVWMTDDSWGAVYIPAGHEHPAEGELEENRLEIPQYAHQSYLNLPMIFRPEDLIRHNGSMIREDFNHLDAGLDRLRIPPLPDNVSVIGHANVIVGRNCEIYPFVTIDGSGGPVIVGDNVTIGPGCYLRGPVSVGDDCTLAANTVLHSDSSVGARSHIGGEIAHSILQADSSKAHHGYLGHSILGAWTVLGPGSNVSVPHTDYGTSRVHQNGNGLAAAQPALGLVMGDYSECAANTCFLSGSFAGVGCQIYGQCEPASYLRDFTLGGSESDEVGDLQGFLERLRQRMDGSEADLGQAETAFLRSLHYCRTLDRGHASANGTAG